MENLNSDSNDSGEKKDTQPSLSDFFKDITPSDKTRKENIRTHAVDFISQNSPVSFPEFIKHFSLKRTTGFDIIRDLEISRIITSYFQVNEKGLSVKWLKIREVEK